MHPDPAFRTKLSPADERLMLEALVREIGFGTIFLTTPDGPRVAHVAFFGSGDGALQFHLANSNALTKHLDGNAALALVNGPDAYISPDWYEADDQVPTWDYVSVEMEGPVRKMDREGLIALLDDLARENEERLAPKAPWTREQIDGVKMDRMLGAITGFEMEVKAWRPTLKLSQNKPAEVRERVAVQLEAQGKAAMAHLIRQWGG